MPDKITPKSVTPHGTSPRGLDSVPRSVSYAGRFGRMFRNLAPFEPSDDDLITLAQTIVEKDADADEEDQAPSNNARIPAGFTYLGQFIDHDLTFDPTSKLQRDNDPDGLQNFRTPRFDLDSIYGRGPDDSPFLYQDGVRMLIGKNATNEDDLPRNSAGRALIGDPRNDENLIVSQLHLAFLKYHNKVVDEIVKANPSLSGTALFEQARQVVRWHYQWIVLREFLERVVGEKVIKDILRSEDYFVAVGNDVNQAFVWKTDLKFFNWKAQPFMPVEFSVAAYRFGHSMVRRDYALNTKTEGEDNQVLIFDPSAPDDDQANDLRGFRIRPKDRQIEWFRFFKFPGKDEELQHARAIDTQLVFGLGRLPHSVAPSGPSSLAERNLLRGKALGLPFGQAVARAMGIPEELIVTLDNSKFKFQVGTGYKLPNGDPDPTVPEIKPETKAKLEQAFGRTTPLWYYVLKEAELICQGQTLGPVGGRIVAEVFIGLLVSDAFSFINAAPGWKPRKGKFGCTDDGEFKMADLLKFVQ